MNMKMYLFKALSSVDESDAVKDFNIGLIV